MLGYTRFCLRQVIQLLFGIKVELFKQFVKASPEGQGFHPANNNCTKDRHLAAAGRSEDADAATELPSFVLPLLQKRDYDKCTAAVLEVRIG